LAFTTIREFLNYYAYTLARLWNKIIQMYLHVSVPVKSLTIQVLQQAPNSLRIAYIIKFQKYFQNTAFKVGLSSVIPIFNYTVQ
jgi:hypothetical protein